MFVFDQQKHEAFTQDVLEKISSREKNPAVKFENRGALNVQEKKSIKTQHSKKSYTMYAICLEQDKALCKS